MKLLLLDIETAPNLVHVWGLFQQNVAINQIMATGYVMCWAAKWYGEKEVYFDSVHQSKPKAMLKRIHKMLSDADAVIHYNGTKFDIPTLSKEFLIHEMAPPSPYKQIDLYRVVRSAFRFPSNKLDHVLKALQLGEKTKHQGHEMWVKCMAGDNAAWKQMEKYNRNDVTKMEGLYERLRPWIRVHPNHGLYDEPGIPVCTNCGGGNLMRRGFARTTVAKYSRWQCRDCGTWVRGADMELPKEDRKMIMRRDQG